MRRKSLSTRKRNRAVVVTANDKAVRSGVVHANAAARVKSHTAKLVFAK